MHEAVRSYSPAATATRPMSTGVRSRTRGACATVQAWLSAKRAWSTIELRRWPPRTERKAGDTLIEIKNLAGKGKPVDASLTLRRGEAVGIAGLVGSGRTEFLRALFGLDAVKGGSVKVAGGGDAHENPRQRWKQRLGMLSENRKEEGLALNLSIADNVTLPCLESFGSAGTLSLAKQTTATAAWISKLGIKCQGPAQPIGALSGAAGGLVYDQYKKGEGQ